MKGLEGSSGAAMVSIRRKTKRAVKASILTMVLYQAFVNVFNALIENKDYFIEKWKERLENDNVLVRYKAKQFIGIITEAAAITEFDIDLYFELVEKMTVYDGGRLIVSLLDGTDVECEIE